jgi:hypothetical protein
VGEHGVVQSVYVLCSQLHEHVRSGLRRGCGVRRKGFRGFLRDRQAVRQYLQMHSYIMPRLSNRSAV